MVPPNLQWVMWGSLLLGGTCGLIGTFAFLQKRALAGDAMAHAALPGVTTAFLLFQTRDPLVILGGAGASCILGYLVLEYLVRHTRLKEDASLAIVLSLFFAFGIFQLSIIQKMPIAGQSGLDKLLFGQAASLVPADLAVLGVVAVVLLSTAALLFPRLQMILMDRVHAQALGVRVRRYDLAVALMLVTAVVIGLQLVGVVLMAAMLLTPAAAARYWCHSLRSMLLAAAVIGGFAGVVGAWISYTSPHMPTGPWMVVVVSLCFTLSLFFAPSRGIAKRLLRERRQRIRTREENVLRTLFKLQEAESGGEKSYAPSAIIAARSLTLTDLDRTLSGLRRRGLVHQSSNGLFGLTAVGLEEGARLTRRHRLWELYLTQAIQLAPDHVHADAEEIEHILTPEIEEQLVKELGDPQLDPHGRRIPPL